jgi:ArpU family phage transcriptional regulator
MNWKQEAKEKLRRYNAMRLATINIPQELERLEIDARSIRSAKTDGTPVAGGGNKREEALINNILHRQELTWTLQQAQLWLQITDRALSALSSDEKQILHRLYIYPEKGGLERLCKELGMETSSVYRRRDKALKHFTIAYYGIEE